MKTTGGLNIRIAADMSQLLSGNVMIINNPQISEAHCSKCSSCPCYMAVEGQLCASVVFILGPRQTECTFWEHAILLVEGKKGAFSGWGRCHMSHCTGPVSHKAKLDISRVEIPSFHKVVHPLAASRMHVFLKWGALKNWEQWYSLLWSVFFFFNQ